MIQRADASYLARLCIAVERGGFWHRHHFAVPAPADSGVFPAVDLQASPLEPVVLGGRWLVMCPDPACNGAQLACPECPQFFCVDCLNALARGMVLPVRWPDAEAVHAIESALDARPDLLTRNWRPDETVGALLAENVIFGGLYDAQTGEVAGDIGCDQNKVIGSPRVVPALPRGDS